MTPCLACSARTRGNCALKTNIDVPLGSLFSLGKHIDQRELALGDTRLRRRVGCSRVGGGVVRVCTVTASRVEILRVGDRDLVLTGMRCRVSRGGFTGKAVRSTSLSASGRERSRTHRTCRGDGCRLAGDLVVLRIVSHAPVVQGWGRGV